MLSRSFFVCRARRCAVLYDSRRVFVEADNCFGAGEREGSGGEVRWCCGLKPLVSVRFGVYISQLSGTDWKVEFSDGDPGLQAGAMADNVAVV